MKLFLKALFLMSLPVFANASPVAICLDSEESCYIVDQDKCFISEKHAGNDNSNLLPNHCEVKSAEDLKDIIFKIEDIRFLQTYLEKGGETEISGRSREDNRNGDRSNTREVRISHSTDHGGGVSSRVEGSHSRTDSSRGRDSSTEARGSITIRW
jgi:outer membrane usher protein FimD/PapC